MKKFIVAIVALVVLAVGGLAIFLTTVDANNYRSQIADTLSKQTGRTVKLNGPIKLELSLHGVALNIQDASISNPSWASRPVMAGIGKFDLGVAVMPLLDKQLVITRLEVANADIALETSASGQHNWDMNPASSSGNIAPTANKAKTDSSGSPVAIHVSKILISDSQMTVRDEKGKTSTFKVKSMTLGTEGAGAALHFTGEVNGAPIALNVKTGIADIMAASGQWPFDADLTYADYKLTAKGTADADKKKAEVASYEISAAKSSLHGELAANWAGATPSLSGSLSSDHLDPADFKPKAEPGSAESKTAAAAPASASGRLFSDDPLPLDSLKSANLDLDVKIAELVAGNGELKQISTKVVLNNGNLTLAPFKASLGEGQMDGDIKLNANSNPPQLAVTLNAPNVKLEDMLKIGGAPAFLSGDALANINIASSGDSMHALASHAVGVMNVVAAAGKVSSSAAGSVSSGLMKLFAPGGSNALNCLAARFIVKDGVAHDNGILADTSATTVAGKGGFDLGQETIDLNMLAKTKGVNVGGLVPPLHVGGTFSNPGFNIDPNATVQSVAGLLTGSTTLGAGVPDVVSQQGQNACVYTLDHPSSATASKSVLPSSVTGKLSGKLNNVGNTLKGLLGQ